MGIQQSYADPGSDDAALYTPFKVTSLGGDWVSVGPGEAFYDPTIGGELLDIKGMGLPFRVNSKSFIYLMVIFDLSGRPTFSGICHTGKNLVWLMPGERWLNYPRMYAVDEMYYRGIWSKNEYDNNRPGNGWVDTDGGGFSNVFPAAKKTARGGDRPDTQPLHEIGWFGHLRGGIEGGLQDTGGINIQTKPRPPTLPNKSNPVGKARWNLQPQLPWPTDLATTVDVTNGGYTSKQIYSGIDRELRKCICAQGMNSCDSNGKYTSWARDWPHNLNDVGWWPVQGINPAPLMWRRQMRGYVDPKGVTTPGQRGPYEIGGYMNPARNLYNGMVVDENKDPLGASHKQALVYRHTYQRVAKDFLNKTEKQWRTETDQVMCFYPIAHATQPTRDLDEGFVSGGIHVPSVIHKWVDSAGGDQEYREREFAIRQACTTNLRLATIIEGASRYKVLMPYQGMHTELITGNGDKTNRDLNFVQQWEYHSQVMGIGVRASAYKRDGGALFYHRLMSGDLSYKQDYIDVLYNNQAPPIK